MKIAVRVHPGSKRQEIKAAGENCLEVWLHAPAADGKANASLRRLLADHFSLPQSRIRLLHGAASRRKLFAIEL